ncbi:hypothetical protein AB5I41_29505 [Sphingomonas sp. MMS24-JH45]
MALIPGGPMPSGLPNKAKAAVRQQFAEGKVGPRSWRRRSAPITARAPAPSTAPPTPTR